MLPPAKVIRVLAAATLLAMLNAYTALAASPVEGFLEPYKTIDVAANESGIIDSLDVVEGQTVTKGQPLAVLDNDVHKVALEIATRSADARGQLNGATAELKLATIRLKKLDALRQKDHATPEEVNRAELDVATAEARVLIAQETLEIRAAEYERYRIQLERRTVRSPIDGVITVVHRDQGEFVSPNEPVVVSVVQLDPLIASFSVPVATANSMTAKQKVRLTLSVSSLPIDGQIDFVSPVMNPQTGTVTVKVRIPNSDGKLRSGEKCLFVGGASTPTPTPAPPATEPSSAVSRRPTPVTRPVSETTLTPPTAPEKP
jgi:membrane fusion protein (multidrug efflux system)